MLGTAALRRTSRLGGLMRPGAGRMPNSRQGSASRYEPFRHAGFLVSLPAFARGSARIGGQELCAAATRPAILIAASEKRSDRSGRLAWACTTACWRGYVLKGWFGFGSATT